ncbi:MAG: helix-turn-helix domain-containing protein [Candidatus Omnitrophota bacterium]
MGYSGAGLKKIRLEKGIRLEEVHKKTKIHINILKAIEGDGLTNLNPVYLKGFIKIYCNFLGVDPKEYSAEQHKEGKPQLKPSAVPAKEKERPQQKPKQKPKDKPQQKPQEEPQPKPQPKPQQNLPQKLQEKLGDLFKKSTPYLKKTVEKLKGLKVHTQTIKRATPLIIGLLLVVFVSFNLGKFISSRRKAYLVRKKGAPERIMVPPASRAVQESTPSPAIKSTPEPVQKASQEKASGIRLGLRTKENCWVYIKVDGKVVFQRTIEKGRFESWQAKERIELSVGNAAAVELEVNGQLFSNLGRKGQALKNILITKNGLQIKR